MNKIHTCNIANSSSTKKTLHAINIGRNIPLHAAIVATAPPSAKEPTRLITIDALYLLWKRKPVQAPDIDAPNTLSSAAIMTN
jgi:hypothetical protein